MHHSRLIGFAVIALAILAAAPLGFAQNAYEVQGNWKSGTLVETPLAGHVVRAQVVALGGDDYRAVLFLDEEFPGVERSEIKGKSEKGVVHWTGDAELEGKTWTVKGETRFTGKGENRKGTLTLEFKSGNVGFDAKLDKYFYKPPTLGMAPPDGAMIVLPQDLKPGMDDAVNKMLERHYRWQIRDDGSLRTSGSSLVLKEEYGDAHLHIEFQTPFEPNDRGQSRGNSGVYVHGRYEVQVLDSFGDLPKDNLMGGIYQQAVPLKMAALPPGEWQVYDMMFQAPRFDSNGKKTKNARLTVKLNGEVIHDDLELKHPTPGGFGKPEQPMGRLILQDHTDNNLGYRNVWIAPLK